MTRKGAYQFLAEAAEQSSENIMRTFQQSEQTTISNTNMVEIATKVATDSTVALLEKIGVLNFEDWWQAFLQFFSELFNILRIVIGVFLSLQLFDQRRNLFRITGNLNCHRITSFSYFPKISKSPTA